MLYDLVGAPGVDSKVRKLFSEGQYLHLPSNSGLKKRIHLAMLDETEHRFGCANGTIEVHRRIVHIDVLSCNFQLGCPHLLQRPSRPADHPLSTTFTRALFETDLRLPLPHSL